MTETAVPTAREVRREVRAWRRGRADVRWIDVASDAYVALFGVLMVTAMAGNVVLALRRLADDACVGTCAEARSAAPWLVALAVALVALAFARLLGPVSSPPAANGWLISTPVDRGALLRPGWARTCALAFAGAALLLVLPAALAGFDGVAASAYAVAGGAGALACVGTAALSQVHGSAAARWLTWVVAGLLWAGLGLAATQELDMVPGAVATDPAGLAVPVALPAVLLPALVLLALALTWRTSAAMSGLSRRVLAQTEHLSPSLSGALSSLDLGLTYDVLLARRWGRDAQVRSRTGGPRGWSALVHRDLLRARRTPQPHVALAGMVLVPYAAAEADVGRAVVLVTTLVGLACGPALCAGLRVVVRTQGLARMFPLGRRDLRLAHLVVPGTTLLLFGLATTWTLLPRHPAGEAATLALACGLSSLAATVRWVTGKPPDYAAPLVSTPAGAVPTGVLGSALRGLDVWAVTALPLMLGPAGMIASMAISIAAIGYLVSDGPG